MDVLPHCYVYYSCHCEWGEGEALPVIVQLHSRWQKRHFSVAFTSLLSLTPLFSVLLLLVCVACRQISHIWPHTSVSLDVSCRAMNCTQLLFHTSSRQSNSTSYGKVNRCDLLFSNYFHNLADFPILFLTNVILCKKTDLHFQPLNT